ncbi:MAG: NADH-quinone oxidoreductase subunit K [Ilumatobacteraceae bacterium]
MSFALVALVAVLFAAGTYLMLHRTMTRIVLGLAVFGNGVNLLLLVTAGPSGGPPLVGFEGPSADALPQALVLTAIVIGFALQAFLLALAWRSWTFDGNDIVEDDAEDLRIASSQTTVPTSPDGEP